MEQIASNYNQDNELANLIKSNGWTPEKIIEVYNKNKDSILRSSGIHSKERSEYVDMDA